MTSEATSATTTARGVSLNALSNAVVVAFDMITSLLLMALVLRVLTREMYGVWAVTGAVFAYSTLLQLGLNSAVNFLAPSLLLEKNYAQLSRVASTAVVFYCCGALVLLVATAVFAAFSPSWFDVPDSAASSARVVVVLVGAYFVIAVPLSVFQGLLSGMQRYVAMNVTRLVCRVTRVVLIAVLLVTGFGIFGLAVGHVITRIAESLAMPVLVRRRLPELMIRPSLASWPVFKRMFGHSGFTLLWSLASLVRDRASLVVAGVFLTTGAAAAYQIPVMLMQALDAITQSLAAVTKPAASALIAEGRGASLRSLVFRGGRLVAAVFVPLAAFVAVYADVIVPIWVGNRYPEAAGLVVLLVLAQAPLTAQAVTTYVLIGMDRHRRLAVATLIAALTGVVLMTVLVTAGGMGLWGVATAATISMLAMGAVVLPLLACRTLEIGWLAYIRGVFAAPVLASLPFIAVLFCTRLLMGADGLLTVVVAGGLALPVLLVGVYALVLSQEERRRVVQGLRRLTSREPAPLNGTRGGENR